MIRQRGFDGGHRAVGEASDRLAVAAERSRRGVGVLPLLQGEWLAALGAGIGGLVVVGGGPWVPAAAEPWVWLSVPAWSHCWSPCSPSRNGRAA